MSAEISDQIALTGEERAWLAQHPHIRVGYDPAWPPFSFPDNQGRFSGIDADILALLSRRLGVKFEFMPSRDWSEAYARAVRGEIDVLAGTARTPERERWFHFTSPYIEFPVGIITRNDTAFLWSEYDLIGRTVAGPKDYVTMSELGREYPEVNLRYTDEIAQAFELVSKGSADAVVTNLANASFIIKTRGLTNLKIAGIMSRRFELRYAVRQDWPVLIGILDKGIASLSRADRQALHHRWIRVDYAKVIRWDLVWKTAVVVLMVLGTVMGFLIWHARAIGKELVRRKAVQQALESANAELHARHEEKDELMRVAGHDLRSPLTSLSLGASMLHAGLTGEQQRLAGTMMSSAQQMTRLIDDLLVVHELEKGRRQFDFRAVELRPLLQEIVSALEPVARRKQIAIATTDLGPVPPVRADLGALQQVIDNLLSNALKFSPPGSGITVSTAVWNNHARIEIRDQGPGVPEHERERIFTKYTRGAARPTAGERSTGLGLAIARELVSVMNGRVWCEPASGGGAVFVAVVPLAPAGGRGDAVGG